jgi:hypothetical protein
MIPTIATTVRLVGFWAALAVVALGAVMVIRNTFDRDRNGLIPPDAPRGISLLIVAPAVAAMVVGVSSGGIFTTHDTGYSNQANLIPELMQRMASSALTTQA